jgi:ribosomal protein S18 acetylase RimI-like enzyme
MLSFDRNSLTTEDFIFSKIIDFSEFKNFDCGADDPVCGVDNEDLNDFIRTDADKHRVELIAVIHSFKFREGNRESGLVAFVSLQNDAIKRADLPKKIVRTVPHGLRYSSFPAAKIGRLGVQNEYQRADAGTELVNIIKELFTTENLTGCRFITVDAYNNPRVIGFYRKKRV